MTKRIMNSLFLFFTITTCLLLADYLFHIYNDNFYFKLSSKTILPALGYALLITLIRNKILRNIGILFVFYFTLQQHLYFQYFGEFFPPIAPIQFINNAYDVVESFIPAINTLIIPSLVVLILTIIPLIVSTKITEKMVYFKFSSFMIVLGILSMLAQTHIYINNSSGKLYHWQAKALYPNKRELAAFNFHKSINYLLVGILPKKIFGSKLDFPKLDSPIKMISPNNNIVLILGESMRYDRLSLFGYHQKTTPKLDSLYQRGDINKKSIFSGGTMTKSSAAVLFNRLQFPGMEQVINRSNNLIKLAKENGYHTTFISGQNSKSMEIIESLIGKPYLDLYLNSSDFDKDFQGATRLDQDILHYFKNINFSNKNLVIIQLRGSHSPYRVFTKKYDKFVDNYDNTILYSDKVLTDLYNYLKLKTTLPSYFFYVSDHGELLGENGKNGHGWFQELVYRIPMITGSIHGADSIDIKNIESHFELSNYITKLMGYRTNYRRNDTRKIYVNGSDIDGLAGYLEINFEKDSLISEKIYR